MAHSLIAFGPTASKLAEPHELGLLRSASSTLHREGVPSAFSGACSCIFGLSSAINCQMRPGLRVAPALVISVHPSILALTLGDNLFQLKSDFQVPNFRLIFFARNFSGSGINGSTCNFFPAI